MLHHKTIIGPSPSADKIHFFFKILINIVKIATHLSDYIISQAKDCSLNHA